MASLDFHTNQIIMFATNYDDGTDDLTGWRYYLLWKIDEKRKSLTFFPLTSNHNQQNTSFVSQYKITTPRPPCLQSELYPNSFVNTNRLITVNYEVFSYFKSCWKCLNACLTKEDFEGISELHNKLTKYYKWMRVKVIELIRDNFQ